MISYGKIEFPGLIFLRPCPCLLLGPCDSPPLSLVVSSPTIERALLFFMVQINTGQRTHFH